MRAPCGTIFVIKIVSIHTAHPFDVREGSYATKDGDRGKRWCPGAELNHRHTDFQSVALPTELPGRLARGAYRGDPAFLSSRAWTLLVFADWNWFIVGNDRFFC